MSETVMQAKADIEIVKIGLAKKVRSDIADHLSKMLAESMLLMIKTQVYHWNVVGPLFKSIHDLTEDHYNNLFKAVDDIAERIRALGFPAPVNFTDLVPKADLFEETKMRTTHGMVEQLASDHEKIVRNMRDAAKYAEENDDYATHDLLVARLIFHEEAIWMLRATIADQTT